MSIKQLPTSNRSSTARCAPRSGLHGISIVRPSAESSRTVVFVPWGATATVFSWAHRPAAVLGASARHPIPPRRCAPPHPVPLVVCPGFGIVACLCCKSTQDGYLRHFGGMKARSRGIELFVLVVRFTLAEHNVEAGGTRDRSQRGRSERKEDAAGKLIDLHPIYPVIKHRIRRADKLRPFRPKIMKIKMLMSRGLRVPLRLRRCRSPFRS